MERDESMKEKHEEQEKGDELVTHSFFVAGVKFHQLHTVINKIEEGNYLCLTPEPSNKYDKNAVRIEYATFEEQTMLGYVPQKLSAEVAASIEIGKKVGCRVLELNKKAKPWEMLKVAIVEMI